MEKTFPETFSVLNFERETCNSREDGIRQRFRQKHGSEMEDASDLGPTQPMHRVQTSELLSAQWVSHRSSPRPPRPGAIWARHSPCAEAPKRKLDKDLPQAAKEMDFLCQELDCGANTGSRLFAQMTETTFAIKPSVSRWDNGAAPEERFHVLEIRTASQTVGEVAIELSRTLGLHECHQPRSSRSRRQSSPLIPRPSRSGRRRGSTPAAFSGLLASPALVCSNLPDPTDGIIPLPPGHTLLFTCPNSFKLGQQPEAPVPVACIGHTFQTSRA